MHKFFISFTRRKLYFYVLLEIFLGVTSLSKVEILSKITNFLDLTILKTFFASSLVIFVFLPVNLSNLFTCFRSFLGFLQQCLTSIKSSDITKICTRQTCANSAYITDFSTYASNVCIEGAGTKSTYIRGACTRDICFYGACIRATGIDSIGITDSCTRKACTGGTYTGSMYAKSAYTKGAYLEGTITCIKGIGIKNVGTNSTCVKGVFTKSTYFGGAYT